MPIDRHARVRLISAAILLVGFAGSLVIYLLAEAAPGNPLGEPEDSKKFLRDMEVYGGKANLLAGRIRQWFDGLWHGKTLALTVACLTVLLAFAVYFFGVPLPDDRDPDGGRDGPDRSG